MTDANLSAKQDVDKHVNISIIGPVNAPITIITVLEPPPVRISRFPLAKAIVVLVLQLLGLFVPSAIHLPKQSIVTTGDERQSTNRPRDRVITATTTTVNYATPTTTNAATATMSNTNAAPER